MRQNRAAPPAPSIRAASYSSRGIPCTPERRLMNMNGKPAQAFTMRMDGQSQTGLESQLTYSPRIPTCTST